VVFHFANKLYQTQKVARALRMETARPTFGSVDAANVVKSSVAAGVIRSMTSVLQTIANDRALAFGMSYAWGVPA
jgi:hypothetical protein